MLRRGGRRLPVYENENGYKVAPLRGYESLIGTYRSNDPV